MTKSVELWFDFSSPNAYYAAMQLPAVAERSGADVVWKPFFLGGLFKALEVSTTPGMTSLAKAQHSQLDLVRWGKRYGVPFAFPSRFPISTVTALRALLVHEQAGGALGPAVMRIFRAYFSEDADIASAPVVASLLGDVGLDGTSLVARASEPGAKDALKRATDEAMRRGLFGAPTYFVGDEMFFGKDRLDFVEDALRALP